MLAHAIFPKLASHLAPSSRCRRTRSRSTLLRVAAERVRDLGKDQENRGTDDCPCPDLTIDAYFYSMLTAVVLTNDRESPLVEKWVA